MLIKLKGWKKLTNNKTWRDLNNKLIKIKKGINKSSNEFSFLRSDNNQEIFSNLKKYKKKFKKIKNINKDLEKKIMNLDRQFLHAVSLGFTHPTKNKRMNFKSKLPNDLENILKSLRNA